MFHVPIRAPTASRMKTAPIADVTPPTAASAIAATVYPFLNAIRLANAALTNRATCNGPSVAATPNSQIDVAINTISTTIGRSASSRLGGLGWRPSRANGASGTAVAHGPARTAAPIDPSPVSSPRR